MQPMPGASPCHGESDRIRGEGVPTPRQANAAGLLLRSCHHRTVISKSPPACQVEGAVMRSLSRVPPGLSQCLSQMQPKPKATARLGSPLLNLLKEQNETLRARFGQGDLPLPPVVERAALLSQQMSAEGGEGR